MRRFFFDPAARHGDEVILSESESRHIARALRLHVGSQIQLFDGSGARFLAEITHMDRLVAARILTTESEASGQKIPLHVGQALLKNAKMDFVVEKCTELGVESFSPIFSSRCQGKPDEERQGDKRLLRWQRIVESACKQCSRPRPMLINHPLTLSAVCADTAPQSPTLRLLFWEEEHTTTLHDLPDMSSFSKIQLLLGPEGGFSSEEVRLAAHAGYISVSLGPRILRAETATVAAVSIVRYLSGDM